MAQKQKRLVFMGTPDFARIILEYVLNWSGGDVVAVYTQPDRPCGRGRNIRCSPVKELSEEKGIELQQPENFKQDSEVKKLSSYQPDFLLVAAYGLILPQKVLDIPREMPLNVHASLLPKYRGAAPIQRAIMNGEVVTGISIMRMTRGLDSGPVLLQRAMGIDINDTAGKLHDDLAHMGGRMLVESLESLQKGTVALMEQNENLVSYAPKLSKEEGRINWHLPSKDIHNLVRGLNPWPGSFFDWTKPDGQVVKLQIYPGKVGPDKPEDIVPGTVMGVRDGFLEIAALDKVYLTPRVKPGSSREMDAKSFECGFLSKC
ncbi:methionyl-tRNA formyltransferase [Desulfonatronovibrio magnus]|uniref:methionyl-tRNA formyltransferase n=1 Tax=Desulfonatronovibrio magnus TaxID=698827 RepID=UPI0005EBA629|nr:methionyl-tRNA formyltransferase [Desulfonatronovibrio magnus]